MFFVILVDDVYCVAIHDLSPVLTALFSFELGGYNILGVEHYFKRNILEPYQLIGNPIRNVSYTFNCNYIDIE